MSSPHDACILTLHVLHFDTLSSAVLGLPGPSSGGPFIVSTQQTAEACRFSPTEPMVLYLLLRGDFMLLVIKKDYQEISHEGAIIIANLIRKKPDSVLGFATGSTPLGMYKQLIRLHREEGLDFSKVVTFNLDEYVGLPPSHNQSYQYFMWENLFKHINIDFRYVHMPTGMADDIEHFCYWYEDKIKEYGGIDLQILGIGVNGHIAFNEPGSSLGSRTRIKTLSEHTCQDNARFFKNKEEVPKYAMTMGVGTIMEAKRLLLLASGTAKADAIRNAVEGPITAKFPATIVQMHPYATILMDREAASKLEGNHSGSLSIKKPIL
jgi:glucosamine-6-phosphate deaminase